MDEAGWRTSSYSGYNGDCVQVAFRKSSRSGLNTACVEVGYRKSSRSTANGQCVEVGFRKSSSSMANGDCVEVADGCGLVHVRDSKNPDGPQLSFAPGDWAAFIDGLKRRGHR